MTNTLYDSRNNAIQVMKTTLAFEGADRLNEITVPVGAGIITLLRKEAERRGLRFIDVRVNQIAEFELHPRITQELRINDDEKTLVVLTGLEGAQPSVVNVFSEMAARQNVRVLKVTYE